MSRSKWIFSVAIVLTGAGSPALSQVPAQSMLAQDPVAFAVQNFYRTYNQRPIWFGNPASAGATAQLANILDRAAFDGLASGPQLATLVRAAMAQAASGRAEDVAAADRNVSTAWVLYAQQLKKPTTGMLYAYPVLRPQGNNVESILLTAASAPSLATYLAKFTDVNAMYKQLRDTAWAEAQASGNLTPDPRLLANLDRLRSIPGKGRYLVVDSGSSILTLYQDGRALDSMRVITGTQELPTPLIASVMHYVTYNPYWHAPDHLVRKTIAPSYLRQGMSYLKSHGYRVVEDWSETPTFLDPAAADWKGAAAGTAHLKVQQDPGPLNSMGILKFPFPNSENIYLHDTPDHSKFALAKRNLSNGCVRVEDAKRLGRWLIGSDPVSPGKVPETRVQLPQGTPIYLTYVTAQIKDGHVTYMPDVYGWDQRPPQFASN